MSDLYKTVPLSTVVKINSGIALPKIFKDKETTNGEYEFFKVAQMNNDNKVMKGADLNFTKEESINNKIKLFPKGSILIPKRGGAILTNKKRVLEREASYDSNIMGLKANNSILTDEYLMKYMESIDLSDYIDTSTIPQINNKHIDMIEIPLPPLSEQQRIVSKLDFLFDKIDKSIALHQKNMDETDVFMGSVLNDVFGELEEKYDTKIWNDVLTIKNGKHYKDVIDENGKYPIYGSGGIMNYANQYICNEDTVIIGRKGTINSPIFVKEKFWNIDTAFGIESNRDFLSPMFLFYFTKQFNFLDLNKSTTLPSLAKTNLLKITMVIPPLNIQQKTVKYLDEVSEKIEKIKSVQKEKMDSLKALKASILDRAFRGEL